MQLDDFKKAEDETLDPQANFSPRYQAYKLFHNCIHLTATQQYPRARKVYYDNLSWFSEFFDEPYLVHCDAVIRQYDSSEYALKYTYEQIEQLKYMRHVTEFTSLLMRATSKHRADLKVNLERANELVPVGFSKVIDYEQWVMEFFDRLALVEQMQSSRDACAFFNQNLGWFGALFDLKFLKEGYEIQMMDEMPEIKFRKLISSFTKLLIRKGIVPSAYATSVYRPIEGIETPLSVEDVVKEKEENN